MNPNLEIAQLKLSNYISIAKSVYEIFNIDQSNYQPEFASVMDAQKYQTDSPFKYSQLFKGSLSLETIKRKSIQLNQSCLKDIQDFLSNYQFTQQLNITKICKEFYSEKSGCYIINLQAISKSLPNYLQNLVKQNFNDEQLNQTIDELSFLFIEYIHGQFIDKSNIEEFCHHFQDIYRAVCETIIQAAKKQNKEIYNKLIKQIKQFYKNELNNSNLDGTQDKIPLSQVKNLIQNFFVQNHKYLLDELQNFKKFKLSYVVILEYTSKILDRQLFTLRSSLQIFMKQVKVYEKLQLKSDRLFQNYFQKKDFLLVKKKDFASQLFYLMLQTDLESQQILNILDKLLEYTEIKKMDCSQSTIQTIKKLRDNYCLEIQQANHFWKNEITEQQNIYLIFDLFILLNGTHFENDQLLFSQYQSVNKNIIMKIINLMNEGYYGYFNCNLIKHFEYVIGDIRNQIFDQHEKLKQDMNLSVIIRDQQFFISIQDKNSQTQENEYEQFHKRNAIYFMIKASQTDNQIRSLKILLSEIQKDQLKNIGIPERMYFERCSTELKQSSVITLFISGFTDLQVQNSILEGLKDQNLIVLNWNNPQNEKNVKEKLMQAVKQVILKSPLHAVINELKSLTSDPFEQSCQEAKRVGRYLAYLLIEKKIFGDCQINIIAHSVGSSVMYEIVKELDNIQNTHTLSFIFNIEIFYQNFQFSTHLKFIRINCTSTTINEILILGGIVDTRKLQKRRWNHVEGRICNVYSKNDMVLKLIYNSFRWLNQFCGLNEVTQGYQRIENYNMSNLILGHNDYGVHIQQILVQTDFLQYLRFLYE